jgi:hypothetical protein
MIKFVALIPPSYFNSKSSQEILSSLLKLVILILPTTGVLAYKLNVSTTLLLFFISFKLTLPIIFSVISLLITTLLELIAIFLSNTSS